MKASPKAERERKALLDRICERAHYLTAQMIYTANHREEKDKGDPKVGGHAAACASALHIAGALHLEVKTGFDYVANKPHAAPGDHAYAYLLGLLLNADLSRFGAAESDAVMSRLRSFPSDGKPVFQSYHSAYDPDCHGFLPSGTVGIPPVNAGYLAHAYRFAREHGYEVPDAHFWSILGDSEFREGSVHEAIPDFAERELGNLTWVIDYNRQSLDGHRITNREIMGGNDDQRIERTMVANGWEAIQVRHGGKRLALFERSGGPAFREWLESGLADYELQALLLVRDAKALRAEIEANHPSARPLLASATDEEVFEALRDFGGHDIVALARAMKKSKESKRKPTIIIAHTLKGWGLRNAAVAGNHSSLPSREEMDELRERQGLPPGRPFARFDPASAEGKFCGERGNALYAQIEEHEALRLRNQKSFKKRVDGLGEIPPAVGINLKMASYPHTQWMLGQCTAKLTRVANSPLDGERPLSPEERAWKVPAELMVSMAPDVGTSTNLNPAMDGKIFGAQIVQDYESDFGVKDKKTPDLVPGEDASDRFLRFDIAEGNAMSCLGSYGKMRDFVGVPIMPLMTVYDFFIKRAHDQFFYNLYWKSSFILVGTPSGVTLSAEGAQHGWKSDLQIPNQITWEPFFCVELDWILSDAIRRHVYLDNEGRSGVLIRGSTRGADQKLLATCLSRQARFKRGLAPGQALVPHGIELPFAAGEGESRAVDEAAVEAASEEEMLAGLREEVLRGAYYLLDWRGYAGYEPGDNVVHVFAMGALGAEAIKASEALLQRGIYANVIMVTSSDLLAGNLAHESGYALMRNTLGIDGSLWLRRASASGANGRASEDGLSAGELVTLAGQRVPIVSVHDGEPGLLDNLGSIVGTRHEALAVRKHSKCGRAAEVYAYHHIDSDAIIEAVGKVLSETALESVRVRAPALNQAQARLDLGESELGARY